VLYLAKPADDPLAAGAGSDRVGPEGLGEAAA
jgi:hypothetical protein